MRLALRWQATAGLLGMLAALLRYDAKVVLGVGFGALVVMLSTLMLGRRVRDATGSDPESGQRMLYAGAVARFVFVLAALALAFALGLHLLAVAAGMALAQAAMFAFAVSRFRNRTG